MSVLYLLLLNLLLLENKANYRLYVHSTNY